MKRTHPKAQEPAMPRRAYPYGRESTWEQESGDGQRRQADFSAEVCSEEGWYLDDTYHFFDMGRSGFHGEHLGKNGHLTRFLEMVRSGSIPAGSVLIIENLDRLSRQEVDEAYDVFRQIIKAGIWICTKFPRRTYKRESASFMDLMEPLWQFYLAHQESLKKSERVGAWKAEQRRLARSQGVKRDGLLPPWLTLRDGDYVVNDERKRTIRKAAELIEELGMERTAMWLNAHASEYPAWGKSKFRGRARKPYWQYGSLRALLMKRTLVGEYQPTVGHKSDRVPEGEPIPDYYPSVLTEDEWQRVQAAIACRRNKFGCGGVGRPGNPEASLFTGIMYEALLREPLQIKTSTGKGKPTYRYLAVKNRDRFGRQLYRLSYPVVEDFLLRCVGKLTSKDVSPDNKTRDEREERICDLAKKVGTLESRIEKLNALRDDPECKDAEEDLVRDLARLRREEKETRALLDRLKLESKSSRAEQLGELQSIVLAYDEVRGTEREPEVRRKLKAMIRWWVKEIWVAIQPGGNRGAPRHVAHFQIYLRGGARLYRVLLPTTGLPADMKRWHLAECDFRAGDVGAAAASPECVA